MPCNFLRTWAALIVVAGTCTTLQSAYATPDAAAATGAPAVADVMTTYANIAEAGFEDSYTAGLALQKAVNDLIATPSETTLAAARAAWIAARPSYMQTEAFRFGNKIVDDWEGRINAWPLDEGLIDYVAPREGAKTSENPFETANVIANTRIGNIDATTIDRALLADKLQEAGGIEANVATGYHAIEFLLWGQDLNGTEAGAGARPATDYDTAHCSNGHCDRRAAYLKTATDLLVDDLGWMAKQWKPGGDARKALAMDERGLVTIFTGIGSLSYGELAGERMKLGLLVHDPEEEHDCFSDDTHHSHYGNALGIQNVYLGRYTRTDGTVVSGPSPSDLVKAKNPVIDTRLRKALDDTMARMTALVERAKTTEAYDQMIGEGNAEGNAVVDSTVGALLRQTKEIQRAISALGLHAVAITGSDSLDRPGAVLE